MTWIKNAARNQVAPYAGAWIETSPLLALSPVSIRSRPTRARGLKPADTRGSPERVRVAPYAGAWIETRPLPGS